MRPVRNVIGGLGNLMFKQAYLWGQARKGFIPDIYLQSETYWSDFKDEIKAMYGEGIGRIEAVSLQIRRGDYVNNPFYIDLTTTNYYQTALAMFPDEHFLVFCHDGQDPIQDEKDKEWCKEFLDKIIPGRYAINVPTTETDDLNKMASCKHNIIANSTFGWWAAYLNPNENKKVICPKQWFTDGIQRCNLIEEWCKI